MHSLPAKGFPVLVLCRYPAAGTYILIGFYWFSPLLYLRPVLLPISADFLSYLRFWQYTHTSNHNAFLLGTALCIHVRGSWLSSSHADKYLIQWQLSHTRFYQILFLLPFPAFLRLLPEESAFFSVSSKSLRSHSVGICFVWSEAVPWCRFRSFRRPTEHSPMYSVSLSSILRCSLVLLLGMPDGILPVHWWAVLFPLGAICQS